MAKRRKKRISVPVNEQAGSEGLDLYSEDKTKEIVGSLFDEFVEDGGTNYFADYSDPFLEDEPDDSESLKDSISRRRKRNISATNKSIVFRKKTKKAKPEENDDYDDEYDEEDIAFDEESEPVDLEKTIILPKLSNFFKKTGSDKTDYDDDDIGSDDEIDQFFASLKKGANQAAAAVEEEPEDTAQEEYEPPKKQPKRSKNRQPEQERETPVPPKGKKKRPKPEPVRSSDDEDDEDEYEEKLVEISIAKIAASAAIVVCVVVIAALAYKNYSYSNQLEEARATIAELQRSSSSTYETELNELNRKVSELTAENESLKAGDAQEDPHAVAIDILNEAQSELTTEAPNTSLSQGESGGNTYTVKAGDTFWKISQSVYGNGANYQKILDANNLTENSVLNEGQVLTIPN